MYVYITLYLFDVKKKCQTNPTDSVFQCNP